MVSLLRTTKDASSGLICRSRRRRERIRVDRRSTSRVEFRGDHRPKGSLVTSSDSMLTLYTVPRYWKLVKGTEEASENSLYLHSTRLNDSCSLLQVASVIWLSTQIGTPFHCCSSTTLLGLSIIHRKGKANSDELTWNSKFPLDPLHKQN